MTPLFAILACLAIGAPAESGHYPGATEVFTCAFEPAIDSDYDAWPDRWTRRHGPGFPGYVKIEIDETGPPSGGRSLRIDLDGGGAMACGPTLPVQSSSAYILEAYVQINGLKYDRAFISLSFLDHRNKCYQRHYSAKLRTTRGWQRLRVGPVVPEAGAGLAMIGLHAEPEGENEDLSGSVFFGGLWIGRVPHIGLTAVQTGKRPATSALRDSGAPNLFFSAQDIEITGQITGLAPGSLEIAYRLEDAAGKELARHRSPLETRPAEDKVAGTEKSAPAASAGLSATTRWRPSIPGPGFYRIRTSVTENSQPRCQAELTLAVIEPCQAPAGSEFGWTLPCGDQPIALGPLGDLLGAAGVGWVKYPIWCGEGAELPPVEALVAFSDRLRAKGVLLAAMICPSLKQASAEHRAADDDRLLVSQSGGHHAASLFTENPKSWYPPLEAIQGRLGAQIRWWQLGNDADRSWMDRPDMAARVGRVKAALDQIGRDVYVGMAWDWRQPLPEFQPEPKAAVGTKGVQQTPANKPQASLGSRRPWAFLSLPSAGSMSIEDLASRLDATRVNGVFRWVAIEARPRGQGSVESRAADLVKRIIVAKAHDAQGIFCPDPMDARCGLILANGAPGDLFLPWRTTALQLGAARYLGDMELPAGSRSYLFQRHGELILATWNDYGVPENVYLGENLRAHDVWGGKRPCPAAPTPALLGSRIGSPARQSSIPVTAMPIFLTGLDEPIARWQMETRLGKDRLASIPNQRQANSFRWKNTFPRTVRGRASFVAPINWQVEPMSVEFNLAPGEVFQTPLEISLPIEVTAGRNPIVIDFEIQGDRTYRFRACRHVEVGSGDLLLQAATHLNAQGELEIEQTLVNRGTRPVSFRCFLIVPDRRRQSTLVLSLDTGRDQKIYRLPGGKDLLGKTLWLRAEEVEGSRMLNHQFVAMDVAPQDEPSQDDALQDSGERHVGTTAEN